MPLVEPVIRPPSESGSFLLQVTVGCSANSCTFCGAYNTKEFRLKDRTEISADIADEVRQRPGTRRVCLMDGDALAAGNDVIVPVLDELAAAFPHLSRVASYANGSNITARSDAELGELSARKLSLIYMGLESGSEVVLKRCRKRSTAAEMTEAVHRAAQAGIKSSIIVLLGLGGSDLRDAHVAGTIEALNRMQPRYLAFLSLMLIPGTPLHRQAGRGEFELPGPEELLLETRDILAGLELDGTIFRSNHASNHLPLEGRLPADRERLLTAIDEALAGRRPLRPEEWRAF
jgi:radical SAM superfamily enzyme YgiQ (UPF0313 family)